MRETERKGRSCCGAGNGFLKLYFIDQKLSFIRALGRVVGSVESGTMVEEYPEHWMLVRTEWRMFLRYYPTELLFDKWPQVQLSFGLEIIWLIAVCRDQITIQQKQMILLRHHHRFRR